MIPENKPYLEIRVFRPSENSYEVGLRYTVKSRNASSENQTAGHATNTLGDLDDAVTVANSVIEVLEVLGVGYEVVLDPEYVKNFN